MKVKHHHAPTLLGRESSVISGPYMFFVLTSSIRLNSLPSLLVFSFVLDEEYVYGSAINLEYIS